MFVEQLQSLAEWRRRGGMHAIISTDSIDETLRKAPRRPAYLLLVGDDAEDAAHEPWYLPALRRDLYRWREPQLRQFASDTAHADLDGDLLPDFAVGRIPARTAGDVEIVVKKILDYEKRPPDIRDLNLNVWAGSPMYGDAIDRLANGLLLTTIQQRSPGWVQPWLMMGDATQPFCGWPEDQPARFVRQMQAGSLLNVFIGHGQPESVLSMKFEGRTIAIDSQQTMSRFDAGPPAAPMILFTCLAGQFDGERPSLAESLLLRPGGPVAVIAASTESHPLTNYYTAVELLALLAGRTRTLGDAWFGSQFLARYARDFLVEPVLRDVEGKLEEHINVEKLKRDQVLMYNLLGDPAVRLRLPRKLAATLTAELTGCRWRVKRPKNAIRLEVSFRRTPIPLAGPVRLPPNREEANAAMERANACFEFAPVVNLGPSEEWSGACERPGQLRLVAWSPAALYVAVLTVPPNDAP